MKPLIAFALATAVLGNIKHIIAILVGILIMLSGCSATQEHQVPEAGSTQEQVTIQTQVEANTGRAPEGGSAKEGIPLQAMVQADYWD